MTDKEIALLICVIAFIVGTTICGIINIWRM